VKNARRDALSVITAFRGLTPYGEGDREMFFGREAERGDLAKLVTSERFRIGLVLGPPGVGKTSLVCAGLLPALRDHGMQAVYAPGLPGAVDVLAREARARGAGGGRAGQAAADAAGAAEVLTQLGASSKGGALVVIDDGGGAVPEGAELDALAEVLVKLGKAPDHRTRFLFVCDDDLMVRLDALERRTGTLFSPSYRFRLAPFDEIHAAQIIERTVLATGTFVEAGLSDAIAGNLAARGPVNPAELQIVARTALELRLTSPGTYRRSGGATALIDRFLAIACDAAGGETGARVLGELCALETGEAAEPEDIGAAAGLPTADAATALEALVARGVARKVGRGSEVSSRYQLAHRFLREHAREYVAPVRGDTRRARVALAEAAGQGRRLTVGELAGVKRAHVVASSPDEAKAIAKGKRFVWSVLAGVLAVPVVLVVLAYVVLSGHMYMRTEVGADGQRQLVARVGRPAWQWLHFLPHSPAYGSRVAVLGLSPVALEPGALKYDGTLDGTKGGLRGWVAWGVGQLQPVPEGLLRYVLGEGKDDAFAGLSTAASKSEAATLDVLEVLRVAGSGGAAEGKFLAEAVGSKSVRVRRRALEVARAIARRRPGAHAEVLAAAASGDDAEARQSSLAAAAELEPAAAAKLIAAGAAAKDVATRRRAMDAATALAERAPGAAVAAAAGALADEDERLARDARALVTRLSALAPAEAARALVELGGRKEASEATRAAALSLLATLELPLDRALAAPLGVAANDASAKVRVLALPLWASLAPPDEVAAVADAALGSPGKVAGLREASVAALGEVAKTKPELALPKLELLIDDRQMSVRLAAARALGGGGAASILTLSKLVTYGGQVAHAAATGLGVAGQREPRRALEAMRPLLKLGSMSKQAIAALGVIGAVKPLVTQEELARALRDPKDPSAHAAAADASCVVARAQPKVGGVLLKQASRDESLDVRRRVSACVIGLGVIAPDVAGKLAAGLATDVDASVRRDAATALAALVQRSEPGSAEALLALADDADGGVRHAALAALLSAAQGKAAPKIDAGEVLTRALGRGDAGERKLIVEVATAYGAGQVLRAAASDTDPGVRLVAALSVRGADAAVVLRAAALDPEADIRARAVAAVPGAGLPPADAVALLEPALVDPDPQVAGAALRALATVQGQGARIKAELEIAMASDREWRRAAAAEAARALAEHDPAAATPLLDRAVRDPARDVRRIAIPALAALRAKATPLATLAKELRTHELDPRVRVLALASILSIARKGPADSKAAQDALLPIAKSGPPAAQLAARIGLGILAIGADGDAILTTLLD